MSGSVGGQVIKCPKCGSLSTPSISILPGTVVACPACSTQFKLTVGINVAPAPQRTAPSQALPKAVALPTPQAPRPAQVPTQYFPSQGQVGPVGSFSTQPPPRPVGYPSAPSPYAAPPPGGAAFSTHRPQAYGPAAPLGPPPNAQPTAYVPFATHSFSGSPEANESGDGANQTTILFAVAGGGVLLAVMLVAILIVATQSASPTPSSAPQVASQAPAAMPSGRPTAGPGVAGDAGANADANARPSSSSLPSMPSMPSAPSASSGGSIPPGAETPEIQYKWRDGAQYLYDYTVTTASAVPRDAGPLQGTFGFSVMRQRKARQAGETPDSCTGTAFVVSDQGHLMTCAHVVDNAESIEVQFDQRTYPAQVLAMYPRLDLAIIKITATNLPVCEFADSSRAKIGEEVRAVGYPLAGTLGDSVKVTRGSISGFTQMGGRRVIQVDAPINPGNSGGPVVNERGAVIGVASAKLSGDGVSNVGFCVPADDVRKWMSGKGVQPKMGTGGKLEGPDLAAKLMPSVGLVKVQLAPDGAGRIGRYALNDVSLFGQQAGAEATEIDDFGEVHEMGDSQAMPFLMGPMSTFAIDPLSPQNLPEWTVRKSGGGLVMNPGEQEDDFPFARPRFGRRKKSSAGVEMVTLQQIREYKIVGFDASSVTIEKKSTIAVSLSKTKSVESILKGKVIFDRANGVMHSGQMDGSLDETNGSVKTRISFAIRFSPNARSAANNGAITNGIANPMTPGSPFQSGVPGGMPSGVPGPPGFGPPGMPVPGGGLYQSTPPGR